MKPTILVLFNHREKNKEIGKDIFESLQTVYPFVSFSGFKNYETLPKNTLAILFTNLPDKEILKKIDSLSPGFNAFIALPKNKEELPWYKSAGVHRFINPQEPEGAIMEKINLYCELFKKEKEIKELSGFVEVGQEKYREQSTKIKLLSSNVNEPILIVNQEKRIILWNKEAQNVFGYSKYEIIQENLLDWIISPRSSEMIEDWFTDVLSGKVKHLITNQNIFVRNKLGVEFEINVSVSTHSGRSKGQNFVFVFHDIQKAKKLEREMIKSRELFEETKLLKEFVHHVTHELRTPMNSIIGIAKATEKYNSENLSERQKEGLRIIINSGNQLVALIKDLLNIARMDKNKIELNNEIFNLDKFLSLQKSQALQLINEKPVKFLIRKSHTVPDLLYGDHLKIYQVLTNLIGNSVKYTNKGKIILSCHYFKNKLFFDVYDTGIGIRPEKQKEIFQKFTQADVAFSSIGAGLGLHISKKLVKLMLGEISIESVFEKGTTVRFYVTLPSPPKETMHGNSQNSENYIKIFRNKPRCKLILAIDDSTQNNSIYRLLANTNKFNLVQISSDRFAIQAVKFFLPDLIILKTRTSESFDPRTIKEIKTLCPWIMVIGISNMQPKYNLPGVKICLQDPVSYDLVFKTISQVKEWPVRKSFDTLVIFDNQSWIKEYLGKTPKFHFIQNNNPEHIAVLLNQLKIKTLIIENLSGSSNALNLVLRILFDDIYLSINETILHNDGTALKLIKDKIKMLRQVKMLSSHEIKKVYLNKYTTEE